MKIIKRGEVKKRQLLGRTLQIVVSSEDSASTSRVVTMGFGHYSAEHGRMEPHRHAEEVVLVLDSVRGWTRYGGSGEKPDEMGPPVHVLAGTVLHVPENEWHVFGYDEGGYLDIAFFYAQADVYSRAR